jgi:hypothetical protein
MRERSARFRARPGDNGGARTVDCGGEELDRCSIAPRALCGQLGAARPGMGAEKLSPPAPLALDQGSAKVTCTCPLASLFRCWLASKSEEIEVI